MRSPRTLEIAAQAPKARVVQHNKRRFSIRLEAIYWRNLERLARRSSLRLGQLIAALADGYDGNNLSSHLRVVSMLEAERALAQATLGVTGDSLLAVLQACPCPGLLLSSFRTIIAYNEAFGDWLGPGHPSIVGADLTSVLQVRAGRSLSDVWHDLMTAELFEAQANVLYVARGRVNAAQARLMPLRANGADQAYAIMWLVTKTDRTPGGPARGRPGKPERGARLAGS